MKIVHLSNKPVYPIVDGGCSAMASMLKCLENFGDIKHIPIATHKHPFSRKSYPAAIQFGLSEGAIEIETRVKPLAALMAFVRRKNYNLSRFHSSEFAGKLSAFLSEYQPDVLVLESLFLSPYLSVIRSSTSAKIIVRAHNVEHELWQQQAESASGLKKFYLDSLAKTLRQEEIDNLNAVDETWTITQEDKAQLEKAGVTKPVVCIPFAIDPEDEKSISPSNLFFHLGSMNWQPNKEAVEYLMEKVWPQLPQEVELFVAGSFSEGLTSPQKNVHCVGRVANPGDFMRTHGTLVSPIFSGSGVRIKVLEALSAGVPVVTTPLGATGVDPEESGVVVSQPEDFAQNVLQLHEHDALRRNLSEKGLAYIAKAHSFAVVIQKIKARFDR